MVELHVAYSGNKKCDLKHPEGAVLRTDAPKDIGGEATAFSPTDLIAAGLASCILTTMAMVAERNGVNFAGVTATVEKHM
ncbi:MAG: OsmC family protein, partial [Planctomycetota bacterium]|nr:OsmC family protein [Planctomycetota bacterium]